MAKTEKELCALMERVNDYWIGQNPETGDCAWERAAYFLGNMAAYEILKKPEYLEYAVRWAENNGWNFYRNPQDQATNADDLSCGETYLDLMEKYGVKGSMEHIRKTMEWTAQDPQNDYWWWIDAIYMALHFYNRAGLCLKEEKLFDKAYRLFLNTKKERGLYDEQEGLWFRDKTIFRTGRGRRTGKRYSGPGETAGYSPVLPGRSRSFRRSTLITGNMNRPFAGWLRLCEAASRKMASGIRASFLRRSLTCRKPPERCSMCLAC